MRDLAEEFVAARIWPMARGWSFPVTMPLVTHEFWREGFAWSFPGEFPSCEVCTLSEGSP